MLYWFIFDEVDISPVSHNDLCVLQFKPSLGKEFKVTDLACVDGLGVTECLSLVSNMSEARANAIRTSFSPAEAGVKFQCKAAVKTLSSRGFVINIICSHHADHCSRSHFPVTDSELFHLSSSYFTHKSKRCTITAGGKPGNGIGERSSSDCSVLVIYSYGNLCKCA